MIVNWKQVVASVSGAVIAAFALSYLGVGGTILGVALGSAAATIGSSVAFRSIEKGHEKVKGLVSTDPTTALPTTAPVPPLPLTDTVVAEQEAPPVIRSAPAPPPLRTFPTKKQVRWPTIAVIGLVFVISLGAVTAIELIAGKPLSTVVKPSNHDNGSTSVGGIFGGNSGTPATTTTTTGSDVSSTTTSNSTTTSSTTTSTSPTSTTTSTSTPAN